MTSYYLNKEKKLENIGWEESSHIAGWMESDADEDFEICMSLEGDILSLTIHDEKTVHEGLSVSQFEAAISYYAGWKDLLKVVGDDGRGCYTGNKGNKKARYYDDYHPHRKIITRGDSELKEYWEDIKEHQQQCIDDCEDDDEFWLLLKKLKNEIENDAGEINVAKWLLLDSKFPDD
ncbi:hypothetical protein FACS1894147_01020 [Spirochaetia bacterium]|nr:hypothetical protein FACS1894147_01020 [Spirochaetia bacterium]